MPDLINDVTPDDGTTTSDDQTQPQTDPAAPQGGTTGQDDQPGTTADQVKAEKEQLYQTKYQQLTEDFKKVTGELDTYKSQFGTLEGAFQNQQQQQAQTQPQDQKPGDNEPEFDPYDPASMRAYMDHNFNAIRGNLKKTVLEVQQEIRQQERMQAEMERELVNFNKWSAKNKIPQEKIDLALQRYGQRFGANGTPQALVEWIADDIAKQMAMDADNSRQAQAVNDAVEKAKALQGVQQPSAGMSPSPSQTQKQTWQQVQADAIAPSDPEPKFD